MSVRIFVNGGDLACDTPSFGPFGLSLPCAPWDNARAVYRAIQPQREPPVGPTERHREKVLGLLIVGLDGGLGGGVVGGMRRSGQVTNAGRGSDLAFPIWFYSWTSKGAGVW